MASKISMLSAGIMAASAALAQSVAMDIDVAEGVQTNSQNIAASGLNKKGAGTAVLTGASVAVGGMLRVEKGTLKFSGPVTASAVTAFVRSEGAAAVLAAEGGARLATSGVIQLGTNKDCPGRLQVSGESVIEAQNEIAVGKVAPSYVQVSGGELKSTQPIMLGTENGGSAFVEVTGGKVSAATGAGANGYGYRVGTDTAAAGSGKSVVVVSGENAELHSPRGSFTVHAPAKADLALVDGGTISAYRLIRKGDAEFYVGIDGGVLAPTYPYDFCASDNGFPSGMLTVYPKGVVVDTSNAKNNGEYGATWLACPLSGPSGLGVATIALPEDPAFAQLVFTGPVPVAIAGDGHGAVAVAEYDAETKKFTGIRVVVPGTGYGADNTTATIASEDGKQTFSCAVAMASVPNTGSLTKRGGAVFRLRSGNTYGGDTIAESGELMVMDADALPATSGVICRPEGIFNLNGKVAEVARLGGDGGTVKGLQAGGLTVLSELVFNGAEIAASAEPLTVEGKVVLGPDAVLAKDCVKSFKSGVSHKLMTATDGIEGGNREGEGYRLRVIDNGLWVTRTSGMVIMVR